MKVYGPSKRKSDGRWYMKIKSNGKNTTISYPKYLVEKELGIKLGPDDTVDHIDRDYDNNDLSNFRIISRSKHSSEDSWRVKSQWFICPMCNYLFELKKDRVRDAIHNRRKGKAGPFCSKSCAGRYGAYVQNGIMERIEVDLGEFEKEHKREYYQIEKEI